MENTNKNFLTVIGDFFKSIGKGIMKIPFIARVAIGLAIGVFFALVIPQATFIAVFGSLFASALKAIAPILVFILITSALASAGKKYGFKIFYNHLPLFINNFTCCIFISCCKLHL